MLRSNLDWKETTLPSHMSMPCHGVLIGVYKHKLPEPVRLYTLGVELDILSFRPSTDWASLYLAVALWMHIHEPGF